MQVLSRQPGVSLIDVLKSDGFGDRSPGRKRRRRSALARDAFAPPLTKASRASALLRNGVVRGAAGRRERGFTLVELMITMAVAVVLIMIAVPSFKNMTLSNKLTTAANDMVGAINIARMEAIKSNASSQLCSDSSASNTADPLTPTLGTACGTQAGAVYVLINGAATQVRAAVVGIVTPWKLNGSMTALRYSGQGLGQIVGTTTPYTGTVADICTSSISADNHRVIKMTAGSILVTTSSTGACP